MACCCHMTRGREVLQSEFIIYCFRWCGFAVTRPVNAGHTMLQQAISHCVPQLAASFAFEDSSRRRHHFLHDSVTHVTHCAPPGVTRYELTKASDTSPHVTVLLLPLSRLLRHHVTCYCCTATHHIICSSCALCCQNAITAFSP